MRTTLTRAPEELHGRFWLPGTPDRAATGSLSVQPGSFRLSLVDPIADAAHLTSQTLDGVTTTIIKRDAGMIAADHAPRVIWAELDDGTALTLLDAQMSTWIGRRVAQKFDGYRYVIGAHIPGKQAPVAGVRVSLDLPGAEAGWLDDGPSSVAGSSTAGELTAWNDAGAPGFCFTPDEPVGLVEAIQGVVESLAQLVNLWTAASVNQVNIEIRLKDGSDWCAFGAPSPTKKPWHTTNLLNPLTLRISDAASWLESSEGLGPLPFIATAAMEVLQVSALVLATALEGAHRRLYRESRPFAPLSKTQMRRVRDSARRAAISELASANWSDLDGARSRIAGVLNHLDQMNYKERVTELIAPVLRVAPGLVGPDPEAWVETMKRVRNDQSHQLEAVNTFFDNEIAEYYILSVSGRWVLHLALLLRVADPQDVSQSLAASQTFQFALANMDAEHYWGSWSALETFRASTSSSDVQV
ncbi:HEPN domain-containing protein [Puerhibacterium sp. TATVAM-FAB25]|uniref:HEPN domain-containing protein n=1 Tax=Puerhibacterium sp. TATVAM-FAB25 TaxID=3093699 RepID=UPI00397C0FF3